MKALIMQMAIFTLLITVFMSSCSERERIAVEYRANGADSGSAPEKQKPGQNGYIILSDNNGGLARDDGYRFGGWDTEPDGTGINYAPGSAYYQQRPLTLYAWWIPPGNADPD